MPKNAVADIAIQLLMRTLSVHLYKSVIFTSFFILFYFILYISQNNNKIYLRPLRPVLKMAVLSSVVNFCIYHIHRS